MKMMITAHLTYTRVLAVRITIKFTLKAIILNLGGCFAQVFINFLVTN